MLGLTFLLAGKVILTSKNCLQDEHNKTILVVDTFLRTFGLVQLCGLKVRQNRNDFFKPTFPPKNKQTNSILLLTVS